jgi:F0F1-type ATP synthase membrane subunit b/b'
MNEWLITNTSWALIAIICFLVIGITFLCIYPELKKIFEVKNDTIS